MSNHSSRRGVVIYAGRAPSDSSGENVIYISSAGGGVWKTAVEVDGGDNDVKVSAKGFGQVELDVVAPDGGNTVQFVGEGERGNLIGIDVRPWCVISLDFAGGGNVVGVSTDGFADVNVDASISGDGNEVEINQQGRILVGTDSGIWTSRANLILTGDGNEVGFKSNGYDQVGFDLDLTGNRNQVAVGMLLPAIQKVREAAARVSLEIDGSNNQGTVSNDGYADWQVNFGRTASSSDSTSAGTRSASSFIVTFDRPVDPVQGGTPTGTVTFFIDGNSQAAPVGDIITIRGQGFGAATVDADTAGGNDSIWIDIDAPLQLDLATGDGDDDVRVDNQPERWFSEGPAPTNQLSIDTGSGDDKVVVRAQAGEAFPFTRDGRSSGMVVDLGEGNDMADIETQGFFDFSLHLTAGAGDDNVVIDSRIIYLGTGETNADIDLDLSDGDDKAEISIDGFSNVLLGLTAGTGDDVVQVQAVTGRITGVAIDPSNRDTIYSQRVDLGQGDDVANIETQGFSKALLDLTGGDGNDTVEFDSRAGVGILKSTDGGATNLGTVTFTFTLGLGDDHATINTIGYGELNGVVDAGDGDDTIESSSSPTSPGASPRPVLITIYTRAFFLGAGDDRLVINTSGEARSDIYIDAGAGNDSASNRLYVGTLSYDAQHTRLNAVALLGSGDDRLETDTAGYGQADIRIDGGDGDDEIRTRHQWLTHLDRTQLNLVVMLGAGSDTLAIETVGYRRIKTSINTGPAGDGSDSVSASHQSQRRSSRRHNVRLNLDGGRDVYRHTTKGYAVQKTVQSATSVEWVFVS